MQQQPAVDMALFVEFRDLAPATGDFRADVVDGLSARPKALSSKYLYDAPGSHLFDRICDLEEYYPTRTEIGLLEAHGAEMAALIGPGARLVEYGCGSIRKVRPLLDNLVDMTGFVPIDISREHLLVSAAELAHDHPDLPILPVCADFTADLDLPAVTGRDVGFFPGSTLGNFTRAAAREFLVQAAHQLGPRGGLLIGIDLKKDVDVLRAAYDDREGVTAAFNLNLLHRINRELGGDFDLDRFHHEARYNDAEGRIEMHLVSRDAQRVTIAGQGFDFGAGESIHTENSHKYTIEEFRDLARGAGWAPVAVWTDPGQLFSIHYLEVAAAHA